MIGLEDITASNQLSVRMDNPERQHKAMMFGHVMWDCQQITQRRRKPTKKVHKLWRQRKVLFTLWAKDEIICSIAEIVNDSRQHVLIMLFHCLQNAACCACKHITPDSKTTQWCCVMTPLHCSVWLNNGIAWRVFFFAVILHNLRVKRVDDTTADMAHGSEDGTL